MATRGYSIRDWHALLRAVGLLLYARLCLALRPADRLLSDLRRKSFTPETAAHLATTRADVERIAWAIAAASRRVPWRSDCLIQVVAADRWLKSLGLAGDFHLGVAKDAAGAFKAHAWLKCADQIIAGGTGDGYETLIGPG